MTYDLLSADESARELGISRATMYQWLADSDAGALVVRGQPVTIDYFQGGANGQGRIKIERREIERLRDLMRVKPRPQTRRRPPTWMQSYPGITVKLGRPAQ
jgi:hypothetical protein